MFVNYLSLFNPLCDSVIVDHGCLRTVRNGGSKSSVGDNTILYESGDVLATECSDVRTLDSGSCGDKSVTWCDFVVTVDSDGSIVYERMSSKVGTATGLVGISKSKIPVGLENGNEWQPYGKPWDCDFYLHQRAFPRTRGASMQL